MISTAEKYMPSLSGGLAFMEYGNVYYDRKSGHWFIQLRWNGKTERFYQFEYKGQWLSFESEGMALHTLGLMREEMKNNSFFPNTWRKDSPLGIKEYSKVWLKTSSACKNVKNKYRSHMNHVMRYFGEDYDIRKFTHSQLLQFKLQLNLSNDSVYNIMSALKTMLNFYRKDNPAFILPVFPPMSKYKDDTEQEYLSFDDQQIILQAIPERHRAIFIFGMEYGLRIQEITALRWDRIDFEKGTVTINRRHSEYELIEASKTGAVRTEELSKRAIEALNLAKNWPSFQGWVFSHNKRGSHYDDKILNKIWHKACQKTGYNMPLNESVRHSWGCQLMELPGVTIDMVQDGYKHTSAKTTRRYAHRKRGVISQLIEQRGQVIPLTDNRPTKNEGSK